MHYYDNHNHFNGHFPGGLVGPRFVYYLHFFWMRTFRYKWHMFLKTECSSFCQSKH